VVQEVDSMRYAFFGNAPTGSLEHFARLLGYELERAGFLPTEGDPRDANLVLSLVDPDDAKPFRRGARGTYVLAVLERAQHPEPIEESLKADYPMLLRALANLVLDYVPGEGAWFTTMERGHYGVHADSDEALAREVIQRLIPLASSRLVIENEFRTDLEPELWDGDETTQSIHDAGVRLGALNLLPNPFPIEDLLTERELRHVKRLYGIGGLSYGNLSARKDDSRFWMSASGVDKTKLDIPGRDILLVSGYDSENGRMVLSVPPGVEPRRVSVDAIEHWMIYLEHPGVGAIVHVHAWVDGIEATDVNYPCGTEELARSVAELVRNAPDPDHAIVGLRNHGITVTGPSLEEILDRIEPRVLAEIPMS
jgi:ribulose-5-phosphate 4-epimerase/fuculose-1-phosphate aldolase